MPGACANRRKHGIQLSVYFENGKIVIKDTGIGIAAEDLTRIFENGYTGCNVRRDRHASGPGLYLCRQICENSKHKISADSAVGKGTAVFMDASRRKTVIKQCKADDSAVQTENTAYSDYFAGALQ